MKALTISHTSSKVSMITGNNGRVIIDENTRILSVLFIHQCSKFLTKLSYNMKLIYETFFVECEAIVLLCANQHSDDLPAAPFPHGKNIFVSQTFVSDTRFVLV